MGKPKSLNKALRTPDRVRSAFSNLKENMPDKENKEAKEYATDNVTQTSERAIQQGVDKTTISGKKAYSKARDKIKTRTTKSNNNASSKKSNHAKSKTSHITKKEERRIRYHSIHAI